MPFMYDSAGQGFYCLPEYARCSVSGENPEDMSYCPLCLFDHLGMVCKPGECEYYTEDMSDENSNER